MQTGKRPRAREAGIVIGTMPPGKYNAITDVPGVAVGHVTLVSGDGPQPGTRSCADRRHRDPPAPGQSVPPQGSGGGGCDQRLRQSTGLAQIAELGNIETPILLTNTLSVVRLGCRGDVHDRRQPGHRHRHGRHGQPRGGECNDGYLNDIQGRHVKEEHVLAALASAATGPVAEGCVGAGTGMSAFGWKGGIGTASRVLLEEYGDFVVGVLLPANFGRREDLVIDGVPVGRDLKD